MRYCSKICPDLKIEISSKVYSCYSIYNNIFFNVNDLDIDNLIKELQPRRIENIRETTGVKSEFPMQYHVQFTRFYKGRKTKTFNEFITI